MALALVTSLLLGLLYCGCGWGGTAPSSAAEQSRVSSILQELPYAHLFTLQDEAFQAAHGIPINSAQSYGEHSLAEIVRILNASTISPSFVERGNFNRLLQKLSHKLHFLLKDTRTPGVEAGSMTKRTVFVPLHMLFVGGSVCYGHHTYNASTTTNAAANISQISLASAYLSWPRRLVTLLTYVVTKYATHLSPLPGVDVQLKVSPRYCCRQATSSTHAVDIFKSQEYRFGRCSRDLLNTDPSSPDSRAQKPPWEPDLVLWDYAVNDMNNNWFLSRPREYVYENMVRMAFKSHAAQIIDFEFINHLPSSYKNTAFSQRLNINQYYAIPMVNYMSALACLNVTLRDWTPLYAERLSNRHPAWPTHVIWAQLALGVILTGLVQWKEFVAVSNSITLSQSSHPSENNIQSKIPHIRANHSLPAVLYKHSHDNSNKEEYLGICNKHGYSSFYDFSDIKDSVDWSLYQSVTNNSPVQVIGNWQLGSELPLEPMKTGWLYCRHPNDTACTLTSSWPGDRENENGMLEPSKFAHDVSSNFTSCRKGKEYHAEQCTCKVNDHNVLAFRCANISIGNVKMEYMTSYGNEWGSVILQTNLKYKKTAHIADQDGRYVLPSLPPIEVNSQWRKEQAAVSISQEVDVSVHDMHSAAAGKIHVADIEYIDVIIRMCTESGRKFKVLSIACC